eukprot:925504-Pelagomonas_calceolata.AAC.4
MPPERQEQVHKEKGIHWQSHFSPHVKTAYLARGSEGPSGKVRRATGSVKNARLSVVQGQASIQQQQQQQAMFWQLVQPACINRNAPWSNQE